MAAIQQDRDLLALLDSNGIRYTRVEHPPVYTCEEAARYRPPAPGLETKNLFLRDGANQFYLVMTACEKRLDLKRLGQAVGASKLHFGSPEQLMAGLGLAPGSVTVLGLVNDTSHQVDLLVDADYWPSESYLCHPMVNTATLALDHAALLRFFQLTGHSPRVVDIPARAGAPG